MLSNNKTTNNHQKAFLANIYWFCLIAEKVVRKYIFNEFSVHVTTVDYY